MIEIYWASLRNSGEEDILLADCTAASFTESVTISTWFFLKVNRLPMWCLAEPCTFSAQILCARLMNCRLWAE